MFTAKQAKENVKKKFEETCVRQHKNAKAWLDQTVYGLIEADSARGKTEMSIYATDLTVAECEIAIDVLREAGYQVRRNGGCAVTISWKE